MFKIRCSKNSCKESSPDYFRLGFKVLYKHGIIFRMQQCSTVTKCHQSEVVSPMGNTHPPRGTSRTIDIKKTRDLNGYCGWVGWSGVRGRRRGGGGGGAKGKTEGNEHIHMYIHENPARQESNGLLPSH